MTEYPKPHGLSEEEIPEYLDKLYNRLIEHRYRYYVLDDPELLDAEYDYLEKYYNHLADKYNKKRMEMVDFDFKDPHAILAKTLVDNKEDNYSLWEKEMQPVWDVLGKPKKWINKEEQKNG